MQTVLLADADEAARRETRDFLAHHGFFVECAADAASAIKLGIVLEPEILIADLRLAEQTSGADVAKALASTRPGLTIVLTWERHKDERSPPPECWDFTPLALLEKPVSLPHLLDLIAGVA